MSTPRKAILLLFVGLSPSSAFAGPPAVPATQEILVLDPRVEPRGLATVVPKPNAMRPGEIDVPPTVLLLRYYYTGDRKFQGPLLAGGPCTVVVHHPRNQERMLLDLVLPPGAPLVHYTRHAIEFDYGSRGISIEFCLIGKPKIAYRNGQPVARRVENAAKAVVAASKETLNRTYIPQAVETAGKGVVNVSLTTIDRVSEGVRLVSMPVVRTVQLMPFTSWFVSSADELEEHKRDVEARRAMARERRGEQAVTTVR